MGRYEPQNRLAQIIVEEVNRLNEKVTEFLDFARPRVPNLRSCDLEKVLDRSLEFGGLAGNLLFVLLANPLATGIGASGAIFALGGALAVVVPRVPVFIFFIPVPVPLWVAIIIFSLFSFLPNIAWQAHLGGVLLGLAAGLILRTRRRIYSL